MNIVKPSLLLPGQVEITVFAPDRRIEDVQYGWNTTTYEGMDALGLVMSGQITAHLNGMYFGFDSTGATAAVATTVATAATDFHSLAADQDVVRVRLGTHRTEASGSDWLELG